MGIIRHILAFFKKILGAEHKSEATLPERHAAPAAKQYVDRRLRERHSAKSLKYSSRKETAETSLDSAGNTNNAYTLPNEYQAHTVVAEELPKYNGSELPQDSGYQVPERYCHDMQQRQAILLGDGKHLVLAPPGCGKTDILAERIARALCEGVGETDILCLTFTNRAARAMRNRIEKRLGRQLGGDLFVGNIHCFCSSLLYGQEVIKQSCAIIDEEETLKVMLSVTGQDEDKQPSAEEKQWLETSIKAQHVVHQLRSGHAEELLIHKALYLEYKDAVAQYRPSARGHKYDFVDFYDSIEQMKPSALPSPLNTLAEVLRRAKLYEQYKQEHALLDFDDLLILSYNYLHDNGSEVRKFPWVQADEVQDLNRLQLAIVQQLYADTKGSTLTYLGDDQQAIFSFIGAERDNIDYLKGLCGGSVLRLHNNYRSQKYLLDVFNRYATAVLGACADTLSQTENNSSMPGGALQIRSSVNNILETDDVVDLALQLSCNTERTAILVSSNEQADRIAATFDRRNAACYKVSGKDIFTEPLLQTVIAHLNVAFAERNQIAWARILVGFKAFKTLKEARQCLKEMDECMLFPTDFLCPAPIEDTKGKRGDDSDKPFCPGKQASYAAAFCKAFDGEMVVFDTETTGLNVFTDDIVQIAALKVRGGEIVDRFNIILETEKELPAMLGNMPNPLVELYEKVAKTVRNDGLKAFLRFVGGAPLVGHNAEFDYRILDFNLRRCCGIEDLSGRCPVCFDTLKLMRAAEPHLHSYKLKNILAAHGLEGVNSHLADDDTLATLSVARYIAEKLRTMLPKQSGFISMYGSALRPFAMVYAPLYWHTRSKMFESNRAAADSPQIAGRHCAMVTEILYLAEAFQKCSSRLKPMPRLHYVVDFLDKSVVDAALTPSLYEQLQRHIVDMNTYKETDLCDAKDCNGANILTETCFVSTVHKAKGLEFDNVIVVGVNKGTYPFYNNVAPEQNAEDARKLYVAVTRAKKSLCLSWHENREGISRYGNPYSFRSAPSPFVDCIKHLFTMQ